MENMISIPEYRFNVDLNVTDILISSYREVFVSSGGYDSDGHPVEDIFEQESIDITYSLIPGGLILESSAAPLEAASERQLTIEEATQTIKEHFDSGDAVFLVDANGNKDRFFPLGQTKVVNLYGGPGIGKTTTALALTAELKKLGYNAEYIPETAKEYIYSGQLDKLNGSQANQYALYREHKHKIDSVMGKVDIAVTDSPLPLNAVYVKELIPEFRETIFTDYSNYNNINFMLKRNNNDKFSMEGRIHDLDQSIKKDNEIRTMLWNNGIFPTEVERDNIKEMLDRIINNSQKEQAIMDNEKEQLQAAMQLGFDSVEEAREEVKAMQREYADYEKFEREQLEKELEEEKKNTVYHPDMTFGEYIKLAIERDEEFDAIIGDVDMPATIYLGDDTELTPYCYEKYGDLLNSKIIAVYPHSQNGGTDAVEVDYADEEKGERFVWATAGYVAETEYDKMFRKLPDKDQTLLDYEKILHSVSGINDVQYRYKDDSFPESEDHLAAYSGKEKYLVYKDLNIIHQINDPEAPNLAEQLKKEIKEKLITINDFDKAAFFPYNDNFKGVQNFRVMSSLNDVVLGVRVTDYYTDNHVRITDFSYATWDGDLVSGVSNGHYDMDRSTAFEDFAIRAGLIDAERYDRTDSKDVSKFIEEHSGNNTIVFTVVRCDQIEKPLVTGTDIRDIYDSDEIYEYLSDNRSSLDSYADLTVDRYLIGDGTPLNADNNEAAFIAENLDEIVQNALSFRSDSYEIKTKEIIYDNDLKY